MSVESFNPDAPLITITDKAAKYFTRQLNNSDDAHAIRFSVKRSGCTGYMYDINPVTASQENDIALTLNGLSVFVDPEAVPVLRGLEIDYVTEGLNSTVKFINPNAGDYCGCGESFNLV